MTERLAERHAKRVRAGALRYLANKRLMREFVGPGGVKLNEEEQRQLYQEALGDPQKMLSILQNRQQVKKCQPTQVPWDYVWWLKRMEG